jgi:uncharacterized protein (DUF1501 family)
MKTESPLSRRDFVRQACCAAVGTTGMLSALAQLRTMGAVAPTTAPDYKALVCIYLSGGNDGNSAIIPTGAADYAKYASVRSDLAIGASGLLPISMRSYNDGRTYGLHPSLAGLQGLYSQGKAAILGNVGTLLQPTTIAQYRANQGLPPQLYSHADQSVQWQSSIPDRAFETGWGGRLADLTNAMNDNNQVSMTIALSGTSLFQVGKTVTQYATLSGGLVQPYLGTGASNAAISSRISKVASDPQSNLIAAALGNVMSKSISDNALLASVLNAAPALKTVFPAGNTGNRLAMAARLMSVSQQLGLRRQIFFLQIGGFDLHGGQASGHGPLLADFSAGVKALYDATVEMGIQNQVTTFTASDFGRTYVPNAGGTDHGWGNQQFIIGGAVKGGDIYGRMPSLTIGADDDTGRGRWLPTTSVDEYNATLATWFGVSPTDLPVVLPNVGRFPKPNLGFL